MKVKAYTSFDVNTRGGAKIPPCSGLASTTPPEILKVTSAEEIQIGVSTKNALLGSSSRQLVVSSKDEDSPHWYVLRATYGREKKAYDYMEAKGVIVFHPTKNTVKLIKGKRKTVVESRLPNMFFAFGTEEQIQTFVYDNVNLPFLRFYYRHSHVGHRIEKTPMIVPNSQMESLKIICAAEAEDVIVSTVDIPKFEAGQLVKVIDGDFKGVVGRVARYHGQQRVAVVVEGVVTVVTAYVPNAFLA